MPIDSWMEEGKKNENKNNEVLNHYNMIELICNKFHILEERDHLDKVGEFIDINNNVDDNIAIGYDYNIVMNNIYFIDKIFDWSVNH